MTYEEAIKALKSGKRIRRAGWNDESWWSLIDGRLRMTRGGSGDHYCYPRESEKQALDWQVLDWPGPREERIRK